MQANDFYKEMFDAVFLDKEKKSEIRNTLSKAVPVCHRRKVGWQHLLCAALFIFLLGAGIYSGVRLQWRNSQYGQYQFIIDDQQLVFPVSTVKSDFLTTALKDSEANKESSVSYSVENWNEVEEKTGIPLLTSELLQSKIQDSDSTVNLIAYTGTNDTVEKIEATALFYDSDKNGKAYTVLFSAGTHFTEQSFDLGTAKGNSGVYDTAFVTHRTPSGITMQISVSRIGGKVRQMETYFVSDHVLYHLYADVWGENDGEADIPEDTFLETLDSLQRNS